MTWAGRRTWAQDDEASGTEGGKFGHKCFVSSPVFSHVFSHVYSERGKHVLTQRVHSRLPVFSF